MVINKDLKLHNEWFILIARISIVGIFAMSLFGKLTGFSGQAAWIGKSFPIPEVLLIMAILMETIGIISLISGYKMRYGCYTLILFTTLASLMFHLGEGQAMDFFKNLAIIGGLLALSELPAGKFSFKN